MFVCREGKLVIVNAFTLTVLDVHDLEIGEVARVKLETSDSRLVMSLITRNGLINEIELVRKPNQDSPAKATRSRIMLD